MRVRVEREMPFAKVGEEFEIKYGMYCNFNACGETKKDGSDKGTNWIKLESLIKDGWLSIVPEHKTLEEKFKSCFAGKPVSCSIQELLKAFYAHTSQLADIARSHFVEVAERARKDYLNGCELKREDDALVIYIINAIRNEGKNDGT